MSGGWVSDKAGRTYYETNETCPFCDNKAMRRALAAALAESTPPFTLLVTGCRFLEEFRSDSEIDRMLFDLYGW